MTVEQFSRVLRRQLVFILTVTLLSVIAGSIYLFFQTPLYSSITIVRYSSVLGAAATTGQIGTAQVDVDPASLTSDAVLEQAATKVGRPADSLEDAVTFTAGTPGEQNARQLEISATASTAAGATRLATATASAYSDYLQGQLDDALSTAEGIASNAAAAAEDNQRSKSVVAQANLQAAISQLNSANSTIQRVRTSGPPLTVLKEASVAERRDVPAALGLLVALAAGVVAGIGLALVRDQFDRRLRIEDIARISGSSILGSIGFDGPLDRDPTSRPLPTPLMDEFRALRAATRALVPEKGGSVVFTGVESSDAAAFVAANLAVSSAMSGQSTTFVDADLRRPVSPQYFGMTVDGSGLSVLLIGAAPNDDSPASDTLQTVEQTRIANLRFLPRGDVDESGSDLLVRDSVGPVIAALRSQADVVIFAASPSSKLSDAGVLARHTDGVILVVCEGTTDRARFGEAVEMLRANKVPLLGVVANRSRRTRFKVYRRSDERPDVVSLHDSSRAITSESNVGAAN